MLNSEQTRKALHYSVLWLEQEIKDIEKAIDECNDIISAQLLNQRHRELKLDYLKFVELSELVS